MKANDDIPREERGGGAYRIECQDCPSVSIAETSRKCKLGFRMRGDLHLRLTWLLLVTLFLVVIVSGMCRFAS